MLNNSTSPWTPTTISHLILGIVAIGVGIAGLATGHLGPIAFDYAALGGGATLLGAKGLFNIP